MLAYIKELSGTLSIRDSANTVDQFTIICLFFCCKVFYRNMEPNNRTTHTVTEFLITGFDEVQHPKLVGLAILFALFLILIGSITNICVIAFNKPLHTPMYFFICSLAMVDIVYTSGISVTMLNVLLGEERRVPYAPCMIQCFLFTLGSTMEPFAIALMAYDRLIAISYPLRYQTILTNKNVCLLIIATWAVGCMFASLFTGLVNNLPFCGSNKLQYSFCEYAALVRAACVNPTYYFNAISAVGTTILWVNLALIFFSYMKIVYVVIQMSSSKDRRKTFNTCVSHMIVVACFFIPKVLLMLVTRVGLVLTLSHRNGLIIGSTLGPSLVNPLVYCLKTKEIRGRLKYIFKRSEISPNM
ncbi:olfactory receptor 5P3-like isoform X1 [Oncorhynchus keta]|uniref:olfactory receptor 5P3-like isoform X1 n=2 Tax=Oncorhynchus keta TaxID=8018 RepID=UPI00227C0AEB|nr:olfactory receptor 5P3-like isoform X1 [Oncorhynchus keta]